jgi:hypothetical protein
MQYFITEQTLNNQNTMYEKMKRNVELENESNLHVEEMGIFRDEQTVMLGM